MKTQHIAVLAAAFTALSVAPGAFGQNLWFDLVGTGVGGTGDWVGNNRWNTASTGENNTRGAWIANAQAFFAGEAGTVTVNSAVTAGSVTFDSSNFIISGTNALTVTGSITTSPGITATINAPLSGSLTKAGTGTLILGGTQSYTGATNINAGTLRITAPSALPSGTNVSFASAISGATFQLASGGSYNAGTLTLPSAGEAIIDFAGLTNAQFTFAALSGGSGSVLNVINYTHSGTNFLQFNNVTGFSGNVLINGAPAFLVDGVVSPIPEPASFALIGSLAALGFAATRRRRQAVAA